MSDSSISKMLWIILLAICAAFNLLDPKFKSSIINNDRRWCYKVELETIQEFTWEVQ